MIPRNIFWIEREISEIIQKIHTPGIDKKQKHNLKEQIRRREKILQKLRQQLEIDIIDMSQFKALSESKPMEPPPK